MKPGTSQARANKKKVKRKRVITDESLVQVPMSSTANDLIHVTDLLSSGTKEIQEILKHECLLIYECKVCSGLFRSIINFVIHKRKYCVSKFSAIQQKDLSSKLQEVEQFCKNSSEISSGNEKSKPMRSTEPPTLSSFYQSLINKTLENTNCNEPSRLSADILNMQSATVLLDKLELSKSPQVSSQKEDLNNFINDPTTAFLREDGTIATNINSIEDLYETDVSSVSSRKNSSHPAKDKSNDVSERFPCSLCRFSCSSKSELFQHAQISHFTFYKCFQCAKHDYHSVYAVLRHLHGVHKIANAKRDKKYRKKVIASKVVKSVPQCFYSFSSPKTTDDLKENSAGRNNVLFVKNLQCPKCKECFRDGKLSCSCNVLDSKCAQDSKNNLISTISNILDSSSVKSDEIPKIISRSSRFTRSSASSDFETNPVFSTRYPIKSPLERVPNVFPVSPYLEMNERSPIMMNHDERIRKINEENKNKAGIQVRMNYDKCLPGKPIVSKIEVTPNDSCPLPVIVSDICFPEKYSPSKENVQSVRTNNDNSNSKVSLKRKNIDLIAEKLLQKKASSPPSRKKLKFLFKFKKTNNVRKKVLNFHCKVDSRPNVILNMEENESGLVRETDGSLSLFGDAPVTVTDTILTTNMKAEEKKSIQMEKVSDHCQRLVDSDLNETKSDKSTEQSIKENKSSGETNIRNDTYKTNCSRHIEKKPEPKSDFLGKNAVVEDSNLAKSESLGKMNIKSSSATVADTKIKPRRSLEKEVVLNGLKIMEYVNGVKKNEDQIQDFQKKIHGES